MAAIEDFNIGKKERKGYDMVWKKKTIILIFFILISAGLIFSPVLFKNQIKAGSLQTSVVIYICGNGIIEGPEICDDGLNNGRYAYNAADKFCNLTCDGWAPYCGDGILQSNYGEECDDGNNVSGDGCSSGCRTEAVPSPPPSGGGGYVPRETKVIIKGRAYPNAEITLLKDGRVITTQKADNLANFRIEVKDITPGVWTFSLWAEDKEGRKSVTFSFTANVQKDMTTTISGIFLPPTIELSKTKLKKGEELDISGQTAPQSQVFTHIESPELIIKTATSTEEGDWEVEIDTGILEEGTHTTRAKAKTFDGLESSFSSVLAFYVGKEIHELICPGADLNKDGKVNLIDFSILLYWWGREDPCADQNQDGIVNLPDFSIMLYYWTG